MKILEVEILSTLFVSGVYIYNIEVQFLTLYNQATHSMQAMPVTKGVISDMAAYVMENYYRRMVRCSLEKAVA
ncbi:hypothetical protein [Streptococcus sanguinis]|uniref:hypothetical protein n=1 Tax=Streptococcus sanguinis TaxID=1305 RepID=UPI001D1493DB|nr:hypothetical protein [Streptococcus sanguinis]MCC3172173.1 hypothetical protein [Streptococcus sanguinis]